MEATLGRIWNLQLVIGHAVAVAKQHPTLAGHEYCASEVPGLDEGLKICSQITSYLAVWHRLTTRYTGQQESAYELQSATDRLHWLFPRGPDQNRMQVQFFAQRSI